MATTGEVHQEPPELNFNENEFPVWRDSFEPQTRREMMSDDSQVWYHVIGLLITIVTIGVLLMTMCVWLMS